MLSFFASDLWCALNLTFRDPSTPFHRLHETAKFHHQELFQAAVASRSRQCFWWPQGLAGDRSSSGAWRMFLNGVRLCASSTSLTSFWHLLAVRHMVLKTMSKKSLVKIFWSVNSLFGHLVASWTAKSLHLRLHPSVLSILWCKRKTRHEVLAWPNLVWPDESSNPCYLQEEILSNSKLMFQNTKLLIKFPCSDENNALVFTEAFWPSDEWDLKLSFRSASPTVVYCALTL